MKKRICLFAGFDKDGIVDDYVIHYLRDLSKYADIYYLADCEMLDCELHKIKEYTKGAWAQRHSLYDFGSYSLLAKDLVGWDVVEKYDELILANDSCYLVGDFSAIFKKMEQVKGFWGLQITDLYASNKIIDFSEYKNKFSLKRAGFHLGSYFIAFEGGIIRNKKFQTFINAVEKLNSKTDIIAKYEWGLNKMLLQEDYEPSSYIENIYPTQPLYSSSAFSLIKQGFPLLKIQYLTKNNNVTSSLYKWERILERLGVDIKILQKHIFRISCKNDLEKKWHYSKGQAYFFQLKQKIFHKIIVRILPGFFVEIIRKLKG